jgi:hypothetical protein
MKNPGSKEHHTGAPIAAADGLAVRTIICAPLDRVG